MKKFVVTVNGEKYEVEVEQIGEAAASIPATVASGIKAEAPVAVTASAAAPVKASGGENEVASPLPGVILRINVAAGQAVKAGEVIMILEAMKMENDIVAPKDGVISAINVQKGAAVQTGDLLFTM
ncbi:MAG: biotin/lipoyl-binding protein [Clostridia bacterium]|nr:biotin/lipoyl-binding protein [Clostridia bacterium]MDD4798684.1 biotin/lipoyl-binding protein [Clostridia bacterium]